MLKIIYGTGQVVCVYANVIDERIINIETRISPPPFFLCVCVCGCGNVLLKLYGS